MHRQHRALPPECALAAEHFNQFCSGNTMKQILALFRSICGILSLKPTRLPDFYPKLKEKLANNWKAQAIFKKLDARACHKVYEKGTACANLRILIIGAGPCGLRAAIENQLLGAKVVVIEKRDRMARNNVLHLWPFVIHDLRALGAKKFYGKFCAGSIDHISIRQLQQTLLKVCLVLGVEVHEGVGYEELIEPTIGDSGEKHGWRARVDPPDHPVSQYEFDVIIGADGKRNTLRGFQRKEFRGKLAIAITANFINRHTEQEASVEEISGVAFIFKQKFFIDFKSETGIDLENIVYYKDETHYFVMTAKKKSLLLKGVLKEDHADAAELLSPHNVDHEALKNYAMEAAVYCTKGQMPNLTFALNARGEEDVSLFDFTSMTSALNASTVLERGGHRLLMCLVGDSLLEPFWPTGSGAARGFLSALDAAWAVRSWGAAPQPHPVHVIAERESIYRLLGQTTPENINRDFGSYTLDPHTRYPNLNSSIVPPHKALQFYDSDDPLPIGASTSLRKRRREAQVSQETLMAWVGRVLGRAVTSLEDAVSPATMATLVRNYRPDLLPDTTTDLASYAVLMEEFDIRPMLKVRSSSAREEVLEGRMRAYLRSVYRAFKGEVPHLHHSPEALAAMAVVEPSHEASEERPSEHTRRARKRRSRSHAVSNVPSPNAPEEPRVRRAVGRLALDEVAVIGRRREHQRKLREVGRLPADASLPLDDFDRLDRPTLREVGRLGSLDFEPPERFDPKPRRSVGKLQIPTQFEDEIFPNLRKRAEKKAGKRRAAREINRLHFEKSLRLLAAGPAYVPTGAIDLELDYGLQQYRAAAPEFGERVRQLERSLMQTDMGRAAGEPGARHARCGTVARLAAELARGGRGDAPAAAARSRKPDDLLRAVGRIDQADWNVREIERQIHENRLGRPGPSVVQRVPKWDKQQFLLRQKRLEAAAGEGEDERYGELDETIRRLDQKQRDSGRPQHGTNKVASLAQTFSKKAEPEPEKQVKQWSSARAVTVVPTTHHCTVCTERVFAAEAVTADGLMLHKACFRCSMCRAALRPGCYTVSTDGARLTCLRHKSVTVRDGVTKTVELPVVRERFGLDEDAEREMDEDEWTDRNFLTSETSGAGGLSDEEDSSSDEYTEAAESLEGAEAAVRGAAGTGATDLLYLSDGDSYGYDQSSEDCASSSGSEWASRREARRREVPAARGAAATDSSEEESKDSESSELETSSATEVSTDSEFEEEEAAPPKVPPAITVTAPPPPPPPAAPPPRAVPPAPPAPAPTPLSRTRSAGGLATKRALELKRLYLLGEPSPAPVRRSDSASHIDAKNVNLNISEIQKLLHPAPSPVIQEQNRPTKLFLMEYATDRPQIPVISIQRKESDILADIPKEILSPTQEMDHDTDSLSDDSSSMTRTGPNVPPPRLEVHSASGELVQTDSLLFVGDSSEAEEEEKIDRHIIETQKTETVPKPESESSESCQDATTLALTENELSDWAADGGVLDDLEERPNPKQGIRTSTKNPRVLSAPKNIHETKNITALTAHVCGRTTEEEPVIYSNAIDHFEFADEGEDVSVTILPPRNAGYMEFVDDDYREDDNLVRDRSINFIERPSSMFVEYPSLEPVIEFKPVEGEHFTEDSPKNSDETTSPIVIDSETPTITELSSTLLNNGNFSLSKSSFTNLTEMSSSKTSTSCSEETSPPLTVDVPTFTPGPISFSVPLTFIVRSPAPYERIQEEAASTPINPGSPSTPVECNSPLTPDRPCCVTESTSVSPVSTRPAEASFKVEEIKRARENQTEVVRRLVLERMGGVSPTGRKASRRTRASPGSAAPPPVPPPPYIPPPPERPPPPLRLMPSMSDPELTRVRRRRGIVQTVSNFFNRRVGSRKKWRSEPERFNVSKEDCSCDEALGTGAAHSALHDVTTVSLAALAPRHCNPRACCPSFHRPPIGPPRHVKIWSME